MNITFDTGIKSEKYFKKRFFGVLIQVAGVLTLLSKNKLKPPM
jgi:hypothetical protein